jgi:hypothetical protein
MAGSSRRRYCISIAIILASAGACSGSIPSKGSVAPRGDRATVESSSIPLLGPDTRLRISGAFSTRTSAIIPGSGFGCGMHGGTFIFETNAMRINGKSEVARVKILVKGFTGPSTYSATEPPSPYRRTPVQVVTASNAATGSGSAFFIATRGRITVRTGSPTSVHETTGSVHARLVEQGGSSTLTLIGLWSCASP